MEWYRGLAEENKSLLQRVVPANMEKFCELEVENAL